MPSPERDRVATGGRDHDEPSLIAQYVSCIVDGGMSSNDVEIHSLPLYRDTQLHCFVTPGIYLGAKNIVLAAPDPAAILDAVEREQATKLFCPPTVWISAAGNRR